MEKVIPNALNYADIKPEAIENQIKLVRFTPTANIQSASPNDTVRFQLQGNGFFDPYSAYIKLTVQIDKNTWPAIGAAEGLQGVMLDRSAHSIISRLLIKSQGTEIERIDQYDVVAAMINDMIYSSEQAGIHQFEGFGSNKVNFKDNCTPIIKGSYGMDAIGVDLAGAGAEPAAANIEGIHIATALSLSNFNEASSSGFGRVGAPTMWRAVTAGFTELDAAAANHGPALQIDTDIFGNIKYKYMRVNTVTCSSSNSQSGTEEVAANVQSITFCIPIYSGVMGVLMPDKKLLPLSLLPLEVEFTINPYAFIAFGSNGPMTPSRNYEITQFEIYAHMLFFEQEVHRSLEAVVAEHGIFINFNTFYLGPVTVNVAGAGNTVTPFAQINVHFKSINSVHWVYIYSGFETTPSQRKLHFVSHRLTSTQIRNGTDLIPSEPIRGQTGLQVSSGKSCQFMLETFKAWNKMHQPSLDAAITMTNYNYDFVNNFSFTPGGAVVGAATPGHLLTNLVVREATIGRCQYGISMEGEELGQDKSTITGRQGLIPFDILVTGVKSQNNPSYLLPFCRCDMILYVRPDLVVTVLGK